MAWITSIRVAKGQTNFSDARNTKAEREFIISFAPGELRTDDEANIKMYCREMGGLVDLAVQEGIGVPSEVRTPAKPAPSKAPAEAKPAEAKPAETKPTESKPVKQEETKHDEELPGEERLKDKYGNLWPLELTCKACKSLHRVGKNKAGGPFVICQGTDAEPHGPHFLKIDGSLGTAALPKKPE